MRDDPKLEKVPELHVCVCARVYMIILIKDFALTWITDSPDVSTPFLSIHGLLEKLQKQTDYESL